MVQTPSCLLVCLSFCEHSGFFCFVAIFSNAIMNMSFCSCFWIIWRFMSDLICFFFLGTASLFPTAAASSSMPTRVLLFSMLDNAGCFYFSQGCSNGCELVVCVLDCSLLVFQLSMSFLATCVYFLEKWLLKSLPVLRTALFVACC